MVIAACDDDQKALEASNLGHGVFTHHLLNAMCGDAADHMGEVTVHSLYEVVSREMASPEGARQDPVFGGRVRGRMILGTDFTPVLSAPRPEQEYEEIEAEARDYLDQYNHFRSEWNVDTWRDEGYFAACRKLEQVSAWFERKDQIEGLATRDDFRRSKNTLLRYQGELGIVETNTRTRWGVLDRQIGAGGFGKVWLVKGDENKRFAYKLYHSNELYDREKVKRFRNGYEAMRMLNYPSIVNVYDYSECPPGFVMDYIEGENLRDLGIGTFMEVIDIIRILSDSAEAIHHAHLSEVIHRDIKPENIVCQLGEDSVYRPYLTDFDLAWFSTQTQKATKTAMGVVYYAAPEQYVAFDPKVARSRTPALDVYSFGQLMYFCFTNRDPEPLNIELNVQRLSQKLLQSCPASAAEIVVRLYRACTRFDPAERTQGFDEIISSLSEVTQQLTHTDSGGTITTEQYSSEVAFQMTRELSERAVTSFFNASGTWQISLEWKGSANVRRNTNPVLSLYMKPSDRVSLENVPNERMRVILNRRIDNALSSYGNQARRRPGRRGDFEFFIEWLPKKLTREDALVLCDALRNVLSNLQST